MRFYVSTCVARSRPNKSGAKVQKKIDTRKGNAEKHKNIFIFSQKATFYTFLSPHLILRDLFVYVISWFYLHETFETFAFHLLSLLIRISFASRSHYGRHCRILYAFLYFLSFPLCKVLGTWSRDDPVLILTFVRNDYSLSPPYLVLFTILKANLFTPSLLHSFILSLLTSVKYVLTQKRA